MKIKTAVICIVVSAALIGSGGYGAYYVVQNRKTPVQVVPVENINQDYSWWGDEGSMIYGSVTSQVAQTVNLKDDYPIEKIYVEAGDTVKEGDPLFSYDMTLQELELEMAQLSLQTKELNLTKLQKDLEKLQSGKSLTALLGDEDDDYSMSAEEEDLPEVLDSESVVTEEVGAESQQPGAGGSLEVSVEGVEQVDEDQELLQIADCVLSYEQLVSAIDILFRTNEDLLKPEDVGEALEDAIRYYRKHLAEKTVVSETDENGDSREVTRYVIKESVRNALGEEDTKKLEEYTEKLKDYSEKYEKMLLAEGGSRWKYSWDNASAYTDEEGAETADPASGPQTRPETEIESAAGGETIPEDETDGALSTETGEPSTEESEPSTEESEPSTGESESSSEESEPSTEESESSSEESEPRELFQVTVTDGENETVLSYPAGELVTGAEALTAKGDATRAFERWEVQPKSLTFTTYYDKAADTYSIEFTMPDEHVTIEKIYTVLPEAIQTYLDGFLDLGEKVRSMTLPEGQVTQEYLDALETAVFYYQQWLADIRAEIITDGSDPTYECYVLKDSVKEYLTSMGDTQSIDALPLNYKELCMLFAQGLYEYLDVRNLDRGQLEKAAQVYGLLGVQWQTELEAQWLSRQPEGTTGTIADRLKAYEVLQSFQEFRAAEASMAENEKLVMLQGIMAAYLNLTDLQKVLVEQDEFFVATMKAYGLWGEEPETEPETEPMTDDYWGGGDGGYDYDPSDDLKEMIEDKKQAIKDCELSIREKQLDVDKKQRIVDGKIVRSKLNGTVISIGETDGSSDYDYFAKVANESGLYAKGAMSELELEQIKIGDTISGMMTDTGDEFTAVIKEIAEYPDSGGSMSFGFSSGNSNVSYYPFYALLDDSSEIEQGEAEIRLMPDTVNSSGSIYLENCYVRKENDGRSYVYKQAENGTLTKQYVTTGKTIYTYAVEILSGLDTTDKIAFPYGKSVQEGAPTKEVDALEV